MAHLIEVLALQVDLSLMSGTQETVEGDNQVHKAVLWNLYPCHCTCAYPHIYNKNK